MFLFKLKLIVLICVFPAALFAGETLTIGKVMGENIVVPLAIHKGDGWQNTWDNLPSFFGYESKDYYSRLGIAMPIAPTPSTLENLSDISNWTLQSVSLDKISLEWTKHNIVPYRWYNFIREGAYQSKEIKQFELNCGISLGIHLNVRKSEYNGSMSHFLTSIKVESQIFKSIPFSSLEAKEVLTKVFQILKKVEKYKLSKYQSVAECKSKGLRMFPNNVAWRESFLQSCEALKRSYKDTRTLDSFMTSNFIHTKIKKVSLTNKTTLFYVNTAIFFPNESERDKMSFIPLFQTKFDGFLILRGKQIQELKVEQGDHNKLRAALNPYVFFKYHKQEFIISDDEEEFSILELQKNSIKKVLWRGWGGC